jgi:hypothetical protein
LSILCFAWSILQKSLRIYRSRVKKPMKTNYQNLTAFETAAIGMVVLGLGLISFQLFCAMPDQKQDTVVSALQVLDMRETWQVQVEVTEAVFGGMESFHQEFYVAFGEVMVPVVKQAHGTMLAYASVLSSTVSAFGEYSDILAQSYQNNYKPGVEAVSGGKILGAYLEKLLE